MSQKKNEIPVLDDLRAFLFDTALYSPVAVDETGHKLQLLRYRSFHVDVHCIWCRKSSTFWSSDSYNGLTVEKALEPGYFSRSIKCARDDHHVYRAHFHLIDGKLTKIGQLPSYEDVASADITPFREVLSADDFREIRRASGLHSHGIGIGAFVYLRRIFERLVERHKTEEIEGWAAKRMDEKIRALREKLPLVLVENSGMYGVLSKGIHELSEDECLQHFPIIRRGILMILRQELEAREREKDAAALKAELQKISNGLKTPAKPTVD